MYKKILVPLDGSELAEAVLPHVRSLAERFDAEIVLLRVAVDPTDDLLFTGPKLAAAAQQNVDAIRLEAKRYLEQIAANLRKTGLAVTTEVCEGLVAETVLDCVEEVQADLIAISTHGRGGLVRWLTGSVTYKILHQARVPVLLVGVQSEENEEVEP